MNFDIAQTLSKDSAAKMLYPSLTFDATLPQGWVNEMHERGWDVWPHFVWLYSDGDPFGVPAPVTKRGFEILMKLGASL